MPKCFDCNNVTMFEFSTTQWDTVYFDPEGFIVDTKRLYKVDSFLPPTCGRCESTNIDATFLDAALLEVEDE